MAIKKYAGDRIVCLSTDSKPLNISNGAVLYESDTDTHYQLILGVWRVVSTPKLTTGSPGDILDVNFVSVDLRVKYDWDATSTKIAQTFKPLLTGALPKFYIYFQALDAVVTATIQGTTGGLPNGTILATQSIVCNDYPTYTYIIFDTPPNLTASTKYAIVFEKLIVQRVTVWGTLLDYSNGDFCINEGTGWMVSGAIMDSNFQSFVTVTNAPLIENSTLKSALAVDSGITIAGRDISIDGAKLDILEPLIWDTDYKNYLIDHH